MPHSYGYRAHTRTLFKKAFRTTGRLNSTTYLRTFKVRSDRRRWTTFWVKYVFFGTRCTAQSDYDIQMNAS